MGDLDWRAVRQLMALSERLREATEQALLPASAAPLRQPAGFEPAVDVWESDGEIIVEAELPGVSEGDIDLRLDGDTLVLGAGIPRSWYGKGVAVENLPTAFGRISYRLEALPGGKARIRCWGDAKPPGGFRVRTTGKPVSFSKLPATVTVGAREL